VTKQPSTTHSWGNWQRRGGGGESFRTSWKTYLNASNVPCRDPRPELLCLGLVAPPLVVSSVLLQKSFWEAAAGRMPLCYSLGSWWHGFPLGLCRQLVLHEALQAQLVAGELLAASAASVDQSSRKVCIHWLGRSSSDEAGVAPSAAVG
jgi:hypothetical protein